MVIRWFVVARVSICIVCSGLTPTRINPLDNLGTTYTAQSAELSTVEGIGINPLQ